MGSGSSTRRLLSRTTLALALAGAGWSAWLAIAGGVTWHLGSRVIRSNDPIRPLWLAVLCAALWWSMTNRAAAIARVRRVRIAPALVAGLLAASVGVAAIVYGSRVVGGADSYGYVSQADLLLSGHVTIDLPALPRVPWWQGANVFVPLGYNPVPGQPRMAPKYPPGYPLLMAAFKIVGGACAVFLVVPILAALTVWLTYLIGAQLTSRATAAVAALLMAASPTFLYQSMQAMSDVPATAALAAMCFALTRPGIAAAIGAGLAASAMTAIRQNLAPCTALAGAWFVWTAWRAAGPERTRAWMRVAGFAIAAAAGPLLLAAIYRSTFGSSLHSGYGDISDYFEWPRLWINAVTYARWTTESQTPLPLLGFVALAWPAASLWPDTRDRSLVVLFLLLAGVIWLEYCLYYTFGVWWFLRFMLPSWPLLMIGAAQLLRYARRRWPIRPVLVVATTGVCLYALWFAGQNFVFTLWQMERAYVTVPHGVRRHVDRRAVIFTNQESGSLRYYSGLVTLNYVDTPPADVDAAVDFLASHGAHPYVLVEDWETGTLKTKAGARMAAALAREPLYVYRGASITRLFDLAPSAGESATAEVEDETLAGPWCTPPVPPRPLVLDVR